MYKYHIDRTSVAKSRRGALLPSLVLAGLALGPTTVAAANNCERLIGLPLPNTNIAVAEQITSGSFSPPDGSPTQLGLPPFCRVRGSITPTSDSKIEFEVWLPLSNWNKKMLGVGSGGFAGAFPWDLLPNASMARGLKRGYAVVSTDTGHVGNPLLYGNALLDASWAPGHPEKVVDFGYRGTHLATVMGKAVVEAYYGGGPKYSYFWGCSGGGRQALTEAQRYPNDYAGIVAGDPTIYFTRLIAGGRLNMVLSTLKDPSLASYIPASKMSLIENAVVAACDGLDGVLDGVLADPRQCAFNPSVLQCAAGDAPNCLTAPQVQAVKDIYSGAKDSNGNQIYPGYLPGGEAHPGGWTANVSGAAPYKSSQYLYQDSFFRYMVFNDPNYDFRRFNYDIDIPLTDGKVIAGSPIAENLASIVNGSNPNLLAFRESGGKLIHYHGFDDPGVSPLASIEYYGEVGANLEDMTTPSSSRYESPTAREDKDNGKESRGLQSFYRLFMIPGMLHCSGGPGTDQYDMLSALEHWVEANEPPDAIPANHLNADGSVAFTRPLCPYPQKATWIGSGATTDARNYRCE
jgi:feruloyl esterase